MSGFHRPSLRGNLKGGGGGGYHRQVDDLSAAGGAGGQVQNVPSARVYVFGDADCAEEEVNGETGQDMPELRARGSARKQVNNSEREIEPEYFERPIEEKDTLQSLALKYGCPMSELKRINNLIRDQDFFGLKTLRIPLRRHGLLTELLHEHINGDAPRDQNSSEEGATGGATNSSTALKVEFNEEDYDDDEEEQDLSEESESERRKLLVRTLSIRDSFGTQSKDAVEFLKKMDSDIKNIIQSSNSRKDTLEEVRETLTCRSIQPLSPRKSIFDGVDCGMRWWSVLLVSALFLIGIPILYFLYIEFVKEKR